VLETVVDFVAHATYRVLPIWKQYPTEGFETLVNPEDLTASPYGWLSTDGVTQATVTSGNNAYAYIGSTPASQSAPGQFIYNYTIGAGPTTTAQKNAAVVNVFYVVNTIHDITYKYGFTEAAFNFQTNNVRSIGSYLTIH
jgi:extracellular elastinolytic metalloproteinase